MHGAGAALGAPARAGAVARGGGATAWHGPRELVSQAQVPDHAGGPVRPPALPEAVREHLRQGGGGGYRHGDACNASRSCCRTSRTSAVTRTPMTRTLYLSAVWLAMYRSLQARGASVEEAARLIYLGTASFYDSFPIALAHALAGPTAVQSEAHRPAQARRRHQPATPLSRMTGCSRSSTATGRTSNRGWTTPSAAIVKYLEPRRCPGARSVPVLDRLSPVRCHAREARSGPRRSPRAGQRCDFRFSRGQPVQVEPEFLHV